MTGFVDTLLSLAIYLGMGLTTPLSIKLLKSKCNTCKNIVEYVDLTYDLHNALPSFLGRARVFLSIAPVQVRSELLYLLNILKEIRPRRILEIGTAKGGTLFCFTRVASEDAVIISVDLPGGPFGGGYPSLRTPLYRLFALQNQQILLIRGDSHKMETLNKIKKILNGETLDFLFIDGDHTYDGVKKDFQMYSGLVRKGGIIAFHDICPGPRETVGGVPIFWNRIKKNFNHEEIVENLKQGGYGIGVIYM
jgi:predicted O-methyltransferase YrrM